MTSRADLPDYLAERFSIDARALRQRAEQLAGLKRPPPGPGADACRRMADACDRVSALFAAAPDEPALLAVVPELDRLAEAEGDPWITTVYRGAVKRLHEHMDGGASQVRDDDDEEADDGDEDAGDVDDDDLPDDELH
jgi:hypothetical protein